MNLQHSELNQVWVVVSPPSGKIVENPISKNLFLVFLVTEPQVRCHGGILQIFPEYFRIIRVKTQGFKHCLGEILNPDHPTVVPQRSQEC
ncbi:hypothetical protein DSECCO2_591990 [anaerobic digester metagenome]